jgi:dihydroorotase
MFQDKGRIRIGADADITVFDPNTIIDNATFDEPLQYSAGISYVFVNGVEVVKEGNLISGVFPGRAARAPTSH